MKMISILLFFIISTVSVQGLATAKNCGSTSNVIQLKQFSLSQDPIKIPNSNQVNPVAFNLDVHLSEDLVHPIKTDVVLKTKVLFFPVTVPCKDGVGSCSYAAWCDLCKTCTCPLKSGSHSMSMTMNISSAVPAGDYQATIQFTSATGQKGCVDIQGIKLN